MNSRLDGGLVFELGGFGSDESEDNLLEKFEVFHKRMIFREVNLVCDLERFGLRLEALERYGEVLCFNLGNAGKTPQKVQVSECTAVFSFA